MLRRVLEKSREAAQRAVAWRLEDLNPPAERLLFHFRSAEDRAQWASYSDHEHGGLSKAALSPSSGGPGSVFSGDLSTELSENATTLLRRSGFAGIRTLDSVKLPDLEPYDTLAMRVRGDGRVYLSSLRTDNWIGGPSGSENNTWQAFIFTPKDEWRVVKIPLHRYLMTWQGKVIDHDIDMNLRGVVGLGISLTAEGGPEGSVQGGGPFRLELDWIKCLRTKQ